jgi:hypothetical protein
VDKPLGTVISAQITNRQTPSQNSDCGSYVAVAQWQAQWSETVTTCSDVQLSVISGSDQDDRISDRVMIK